MIGSPAITLDRHRVRQRDAEDVVELLLEETRKSGASLALWVQASGEFKVTADGGPAHAYMREHEPRALVGLYGPDAYKADILEAVWKRCEQIGMEWPR